MSDFTSHDAMQSPPPDPTKHVNYSLGMILGVEEFTQEFAYLAERDRWTTRDLLGYGTLWGLQVDSRMNGTEAEITVSPGVAVSPSGRLIRVTPTQCAQLNAWLRAHNKDLTDRGTPVLGPSRLTLYVVLSYRKCETDKLPIPGEPCRNEADTVKPSRFTDDYELELRLAAPAQPEEAAVRAFASWLSASLSLSSTAGSSMAWTAFQKAVRAAKVDPLPPVPAWPAMTIPVYSADLRKYLAEAFRIWTTELRPLWRPNWLGEVHSCSGTLAPEMPIDGDSLLLAALDLPITRALNVADWVVQLSPDPDPPLSGLRILEDARPFLPDLRLLKEWLLNGKGLQGAKSDPKALSVLAAGWVSGNPATIGSGYNGLKAVGTGPGVIVFGFNSMPAVPAANTTGNYCVQVMLANPPGPAAPALSPDGVTLVFAGYNAANGGLPAGFSVLVTKAGAPVDAATIQKLYFMVQVSQFQ